MEVSSLGNTAASLKVSTEPTANSGNTNTAAISSEPAASVDEESQASQIPPAEPTGQSEAPENNAQGAESQSGGQVDVLI